MFVVQPTSYLEFHSSIYLGEYGRKPLHSVFNSGVSVRVCTRVNRRGHLFSVLCFYRKVRVFLQKKDCMGLRVGFKAFLHDDPASIVGLIVSGNSISFSTETYSNKSPARTCHSNLLQSAPKTELAGKLDEFDELGWKTAETNTVKDSGPNPHVTIPSAPYHVAPLVLCVDAMTHLRSLSGKEPVTGDTRPTYTYKTQDLADTFLAKYETFAKAHARIFTGGVTLCLVFDKAGAMPPEKHTLQKERVDRDKSEVYNIDPTTQSVHFVDTGMVVDGAPPVAINMTRLCLSRSLRPYFYTYLAERAAKRKWSTQVRLILDAEFADFTNPTAPPRGCVRVLDVRSERIEQPTMHSFKPAFAAGEGEVGAMLWGLEFSRSHHCQIWSGDSDMLALMILHGHRFVFSLTAVLSNRYLFRYRSAVQEMHAHGLTQEQFLLAAAVTGTDYTSSVKSLTLARVPDKLIWTSVRRWIHGGPTATGATSTQTRPAWCNTEGLKFLLRDVYTVVELRRENKNRKTFSSEDLNETRRTAESLRNSAGKRKIKMPEDPLICQAFVPFQFVCNYWITLQGYMRKFVPTKSNMISPQHTTGEYSLPFSLKSRRIDNNQEKSEKRDSSFRASLSSMVSLNLVDDTSGVIDSIHGPRIKHLRMADQAASASWAEADEASSGYFGLLHEIMNQNS